MDTGRGNPNFRGNLILLTATALILTFFRLSPAQDFSKIEQEFFAKKEQAKALGDYGEAARVLKKWVSHCEAEYGPSHNNTLSILMELAEALQLSSQFEEAIEQMEKMADAFEAAGMERTSQFAILQANIGACRTDIGDGKGASQAFAKAAEILRAIPGEEGNLLHVLKNAGNAELSVSRYQEAEVLLNEALEIARMIDNPPGPATAGVLNYLGVLYIETGKLKEGQSALEEALRYSARLFPDGELAMEIQGNLASVHKAAGDYEEAVAGAERSLDLCISLYGTDHPRTANALNLLATCYQDTGRLEEGEEKYLAALQIIEGTNNPAYSDTRLTVLMNMAALENDFGNFEGSHEFLKRAQIAALDSPNTSPGVFSRVLHNLAYWYQRAGGISAAIPLYEDAIEMQRTAVSVPTAYEAIALKNLARCLLATGEAEKASVIGKQALAILENLEVRDRPAEFSTHALAGDILHAEGKYEEAKSEYHDALGIAEGVWPDGNPKVEAPVLSAELLACLDLGQTDLAQERCRESLRRDLEVWEEMLAFTSEEQRMNWRFAREPHALPASLGMAEETSLALIRTKGIVAESILEDRRIARQSRVPGVSAQVDELTAVRRQLARKILGGESIPENGKGVERDLEKRLEEIEKELARNVRGTGATRRAFAVDPDELFEKFLPEDAAFIDCFRYEKYLGANRWQFRYGAVVHAHGKDPVLIDFGDEAELNEKVAGVGRLMRESPDDTAFLAAARDLYKTLVVPVESIVGDVRKWIISPDGDLGLLSYGILTGQDGVFLSETRQISYLNSARDLAGPPVEDRDYHRAGFVLVVGDPDFTQGGNNEDSVADTPLSRSLTQEYGKAIPQFPPLPGTRLEAEFVEGVFRSNGWDANLLLDERASEELVPTYMESADFLHFATHGFFLQKEEKEEADLSNSSAEMFFASDPAKTSMLRGGLALAGANRTLEKWREGFVPAPWEDGIFLASEIGSLNLLGVRLAVLSACDTGTGEAMAGEGVIGLRRAFLSAGVEEMMLTLWEIGDKETVDIMEQFYGEYFNGVSAADALGVTQKETLSKLRVELGPALAARLAGAFIVIGK